MTIAEIEEEMHILLKEAHNLGNELGYRNGVEDAKASYRQGYDEGLNDAWECFKKLVYPVKDGGFSTERLCEIFGTSLPSHIIRDFSPSEAVQEIKGYEEKQKQADAEISVGDEVYIINENDKSVVTNIFNASHGPVAMLLSGDAKWIDVGLQYLNKTGKHYPQIAEVMKELRGDGE